MIENKKYHAFISYKREDEKWAKWVQKQLECYKIPQQVRQQNTGLSQSLRPVFRDATHLDGSTLLSSITDALENSKYLIVICSPQARKSVWVDREVNFFIRNGKEKFIIPLVVDGEPHSQNPDLECLPESIRVLTSERELLCIRLSETGREGTIVRIVSRITNISFAELWQRYRREQKRKTYLKMAILSVTLVIAVCLAIVFHHQKQEIEAQNWELMKSQSIITATLAERMAESGDCFTASMMAMNALPRDLDKPDRPYTPQAERALRTALCTRGGMFNGHMLETNVAIFNKKADVVITGSNDKTIKIWNAYNGVCKKTLYGHENSIINVELNSNESMLMSHDNDGTIKIWDTNTFTCISTISTNPDESSSGVKAQFDSSGECIIAFVNKSLNVYDAISGKCLSTTFFPEMNSHSSCKWVGENYTLTETFLRGTYELWDNETQKIIRTFNYNQNPVIHADNKHFEILNDEGVLNVYSLETGEFEISAVVGKDGYSISSDLKRIALKKDHSIQILDVANRDTLIEFKCPYSESNSIVWSPDMKSVITFSSDGKPIIWNLEKNAPRPLIPNAAHARMRVKYSHDGEMIAYTIGDTLKVLSANSQKLFLETVAKGLQYGKSVFSPDDACILESNQDSSNTLNIYHIGQKKLIDSIHTKGSVQCISFSHDEKILAIGTAAPLDVNNFKYNIYGKDINYLRIRQACGEAFIHLWDFSNNCMISCLENNFGAVRVLKFTADDTKLISGTNDGAITIWDLKTFRPIKVLRGHTEPVSSIILSDDDSSIISSSWDGSVRIWDMESGECERIIHAHSQHILDMEMMDDREYFVTLAVNEAKVYSTKTWKPIYTIDDIGSLSLYDENYLLISRQGNIHMYDIPSGECVMIYEGTGHSFSCNPSQGYIASVGNNGLFLFQIENLQDIINNTRALYNEHSLPLPKNHQH